MALQLGWVDIALAVFLLLSTAVGLMRGLVFELMSLAGWFVAGFAAIALAPLLEPHLAIGDPDTTLRHGATVAIVFLLALLIWGIGARLVRAMVRSTPLSGIDRLLGSGFGLVRGLLVLVLLSVAVGISPLGRSTAWRESHGAAWLEAAWQALRPLLFDGSAPSTTA